MLSITYRLSFLLIILRLSDADYIRCSSKCSQLTIPFDRLETLQIECHDNKNNSDIYESALVCLVDYRIDYDAKNVYVQFKSTNDTKDYQMTVHSEYLVQAIWLGFNHGSSQPNITHRQYGCKTEDDCARKFYSKSIDWLISDGRSFLEKIHRKMFDVEKRATRFRCIDKARQTNRTARLCRTKLCYAELADQSSADLSHRMKQRCDNERSPTFFSEIEYYSPDLNRTGREFLEYRCNRDLCNRIEAIKVVEKLVHLYTRWNFEETSIIVKSSGFVDRMTVALVAFLNVVVFARRNWSNRTEFLFAWFSF